MKPLAAVCIAAALMVASIAWWRAEGAHRRLDRHAVLHAELPLPPQSEGTPTDAR